MTPKRNLSSRRPTTPGKPDLTKGAEKIASIQDVSKVTPEVKVDERAAETIAPAQARNGIGASSSTKPQVVRLQSHTSTKDHKSKNSTTLSAQKKPTNGWRALVYRRETWLIIGLLLISLVAHAWGMFHYPYYENDEATYASRAWAFVTEGRLDVYTYRYDHAPLGWMLLGLWQVITGGAHIFGSLLASGRVLMLLLHLASTFMVYAVAKRLMAGSRYGAAIAALVFALSPLGIYFQRRILLDNIMVFWLLASLMAALQPARRIKFFVLSALFFGISVLTKLYVIFLFPAILYIVLVRSHKKHRLHAAFLWLGVVGFVVGSFFLYALLKGELLPAPLDADGKPLHVSVVDTFRLQLGRGDFALPWDPKSNFYTAVKSWALKDWTILAAGAISTLFVGIVALRRLKAQPLLLAIPMMVVLYVGFLARGKIVLDLYVTPLIPLLSLAIGAAAYVVRGYINTAWLRGAFSLALIAAGVVSVIIVPQRQYTTDETTNQLMAIAWVEKNIPKDAIIATDNYAYTYLAQEDNYQNVSYFFTTEYDPEVQKSYGNDWRNVDYLLLTHEVVQQVKTGTVPKMKQLLRHSTRVADFSDNRTSYIDLKNDISTNGDWAMVYKTKSRNEIVLQDSWQYFKAHFVVSYGQVVDTTNEKLTTSDGQAKAMLRAVEAGDKDSLDGIWSWSKDHLRYRSTDKLLSWKWELVDKTYRLGDSNNNCGADETIAYALYKADQRWPNKGYKAQADEHIRSWWDKCIFTANGRYLVDSSADGSRDTRLVNPSYFQPHMYREFAKQQPQYKWDALIDDGYVVLDTIVSTRGYIPNWVNVDLNGVVRSAQPVIGNEADNFGYDSLQAIYGLSKDAVMHKNANARKLLETNQAALNAFLVESKSPAARAANLVSWQALGNQTNQTVQSRYKSDIYKHYNPLKGSWDDGYNFFDQVWYWQWHSFQESLPETRRADLM